MPARSVPGSTGTCPQFYYGLSQVFRERAFKLSPPSYWIPAFAGMTHLYFVDYLYVDKLLASKQPDTLRFVTHCGNVCERREATQCGGQRTLQHFH